MKFSSTGVRCVRTFALLFFFAAGAARAAYITDFSGAMAPANWTLTPDQGTVAFNTATPANELSFTGPTGNLSPSFDQASITTHFSGLMYMSFAWTFNVEGATGGSLEIEVGGANPTVYSGGSGYTAGFSASAPDVVAVEPGDTITFLMTSDPTSASGKAAPLLKFQIFPS